MRKIIIGIIILIAYSCSEKTNAEFLLTGTTSGIENGAMLYIDHNNKPLDSTVVTDNSFEFKTKLPNTPIQLWLHNKNFSDYRAFWAENNPMKFNATKNDFRNAIITGSVPEELSFNFYQQIDTLPRSERQKMEIEFAEKNPKSIVSV